MQSIAKTMNPKVDRMDAACFDGHYVTGDVTEDMIKVQCATSKGGVR